MHLKKTTSENEKKHTTKLVKLKLKLNENCKYKNK